MNVLLQRVHYARCIIEGAIYSEIKQGLLAFVSFHQDDTEALLVPMAKKIAHLRIFEDDAGKMNHAAKDLNVPILSISQFTLEANTEKGHRPSFTDSLNKDTAEIYYTLFNEALHQQGLSVKSGVFSARMNIELSNDGPVTILLKRSQDHDS